MMVAKKDISVSETSAENLIAGWCLFASLMNCAISPLFVFQSENMSSALRFQTNGLIAFYMSTSGVLEVESGTQFE